MITCGSNHVNNAIGNYIFFVSSALTMLEVERQNSETIDTYVKV